MSKSELVSEARKTLGYKGKKVTDGACLPLGMVLADIVPVEAASLEILLQFQEELGLFLDDPDSKGKSFPSPFGGGWTNYTYRIMMGERASGNLRSVLLPEIKTISELRILLGEAPLMVSVLSDVPPTGNGRPVQHAVYILGADEQSGILRIASDLPEGHKCQIVNYLLEIDETRIIGKILFDDLLVLAKQSEVVMRQYYREIESNDFFSAWNHLLIAPFELSSSAANSASTD